jgi:hypothetical protein
MSDFISMPYRFFFFWAKEQASPSSKQGCRVFDYIWELALVVVMGAS